MTKKQLKADELPNGDGPVSDADERKSLFSMLDERGVEYDATLPTDELRALAVSSTSKQAKAKKG